MKVSRDVLQTIINYKNVASKDETRPNLCTIALRFKVEGEIEITSADGYCIIRSTHKHEGKVFKSGHYISIPTFELSKLELYLKSNKEIKTFEFCVRYEELIIIGRHIDDTDGINIRLLQRDYVSIDRFWPTDKNKTTKVSEIAFNPFFLCNIMKAIAPTTGLQKRIPAFHFYLSGEKNPMYAECTFDGIKHEFLLMPVRM